MMMLSWNYRGLGNYRTVRVLRDLVKSRKPNFLFLSETITVSNKIKELCVQLVFFHYFSVDIVDRGGGLAIFWKQKVKCTVADSSLNHIDVYFSEVNALDQRLTCFYGYPERARRKDC